MSGNVQVLSATFLRSVSDLKQLTPSEVPEVAFVGRSNVGKSSLLNALCSVRALARTSKLPGRTQMLNFFEITYRLQAPERTQAEKKLCHFVDLPGFGYARVSKEVQQPWAGLIEGYLLRRPNLALVVLLADCRRELGEEEQKIAALGKDGNLVLVLTKGDKLSKSELKNREKQIQNELGFSPGHLVSASVLGGKKGGVDQLREMILGACEA